MRKFVLQSKKGKSSIVEVECEIVQPVEDPSVLWLQPGEYRARILAPASFHQRIEKVVDGKKEPTMVPDIWYSHSFYETLEAAQAECVRLIRSEMVDFAVRKHREPASEDEVQAAIAAVEVVMLTA